MFNLSGRVAVVIGGTSGIGRTLALGLADAGADVVATGRRADRLREVAGEIEHRGRRTLQVSADVADPASLGRLRDECVSAFGTVDILVCAAGVTKKVSTVEMDEADWHQILDTNLTGTLRSCQVFARDMITRRYGRIINIASLA